MSATKKILSLALVAAFFSLPFAAKASEYPMVGEIKVGNYLNVRSTPTADGQVLGRLKNQEKVVVTAKKGDYYQLQYPSQLGAWIAGWMLLEDGKTGKDRVAKDQVHVRSAPGTEAPSIATLKKGTEVNVLEVNKDKWAKITPPEGCTGWVSSKYVTIKSSMREAVAEKEKETGARGLLVQCRARLDAHLKKNDISEEEYIELRKDLDRVSQMLPRSAESEDALKMKSTLTEFNNVILIKKTKDEVKAKYDEKIKEIDEEHKKKVEEVFNPPPPQKKFEFEGWMEDIGGILFRPATHKLTEAGKNLIYVKAARNDISLDDFVGKRVGINGTVERFRGWGRIVAAEEIEVLFENKERFIFSPK